MTEHVFVVERQRCFCGNWPQGFRAADRLPANLLTTFAAEGTFVDRATAEQNPEWKQLIPYCVLRRPQSVFCVQRRPTQTEARLHLLLSIGIGGHINPEVAPLEASPASGGQAFFARALQRELDEEMHGLELEGRRSRPLQPLFQGLLNDDSNDVGKVHAGLVYAIDLPEQMPIAELPRIREVSKMAGGFRSLAELAPLWQDPGRFESWSRLLFQAGIAGTHAVTRGLRTPSVRPDSSERNSTNG